MRCRYVCLSSTIQRLYCIQQYTYPLSADDLASLVKERRMDILGPIFGRKDLSKGHRDFILGEMIAHGDVETLKCYERTIGLDANRALEEDGAMLPPLLIAMMYKNEPVAMHLLKECRANLQFVKAGMEPTHLAAYYGLYHVLKYLVDEKGEDVMRYTPEGHAAICYALEGCGDDKVVSFLIGRMHDPSRIEHPCARLCRSKKSVLLHIVNNPNAEKLMKYLLNELKVDANARDASSGETFAHLAIESAHYQLAKSFLKMAPQMSMEVDSCGNTLLHVTCHSLERLVKDAGEATWQERDAFVRRLVDGIGIDVLARNRNGRTALDIEKEARLKLGLGPDVWLDQNSPIYYLSRKVAEKVSEFMVATTDDDR